MPWSAALLLLPAPQADPAWLEALAPGRAAAQAAGRDLLVVFTGSDWCAPCETLRVEVLERREFLHPAAAEFVLVLLDFPRKPEAKARVPDAAGNARAAEEWSVRSFPTVVLADAEGVAYAATGYQDLAAAEFLEDLRELRRAAAVLRPRVAALAAGLAGAEPNAEAARAAIDLVRSAEPRLLLRERLLAPLRAARAVLGAADPELGRDCLRLLIETGRGTPAEEAEAIAADPRNEAGLYERVLLQRLERVQFVDEMEAFNRELERFVAAGRYHDAAACTRMLIQASRYYHNYLARPQGARRMAERASELGAVAPEDVAWLRKMLGS